MLVANGFSQKEGIDYNAIFSPVVKHTSIRVLLSLVAQHDMELEQIDVNTAFLHRDLKETIYMAREEGFVNRKGRPCVQIKEVFVRAQVISMTMIQVLRLFYVPNRLQQE